uniref:Unique cartilage matrix-associated protein n=1 Tax=Callorhinchus milii TaxID=7868 RepID=A0A4W3GWM1_CALMI
MSGRMQELLQGLLLLFTLSKPLTNVKSPLNLLRCVCLFPAAENRQRLTVDERRKENHEEQLHEWENYVEEERDGKSSHLSHREDVPRRWTVRDLHPSWGLGSRGGGRRRRGGWGQWCGVGKVRMK